MLSRDLASDRVIRCQESGRGAMMVVVVFHRSGKRKSLCRECGAERWGGVGVGARDLPSLDDDGDGDCVFRMKEH